jgi:predicted TIM-barrel enzyme
MSRIELPPRAVLPVIHPVGATQVLTQVETAMNAGAVGVFLINNPVSGHEEITSRQLLDLYAVVKEKFPKLWVGLNFLGSGPSQAVNLAGEVQADGLQLDDIYILEDRNEQQMARKIRDLQMAAAPGTILFGGVAFKYARPVQSLRAAAQKAAPQGLDPLMDVVTTSGDATGSAAPTQKVKVFREEIGPNRKLALASGVTPENVADYLPLVDYFLVATGISSDFTTLDPHRTTELIRLCSDFSLSG